MPRQEREMTALLMHPDTPQQRAARTFPTPLLAMLGDRAVAVTRRQYGDVPLVWRHYDLLMREHHDEEVTTQ